VWYPLADILLDHRKLYNEDTSFLYKYCFSIYHSVNILLGEEMMPVNELQAIILSVVLLFGEFIQWEP
jgi:hypothetical protein